MSSSDEEHIEINDVSGSESEDFKPTKKVQKAPAKPKATKAPAKTSTVKAVKAAPAKKKAGKVLKPIDNDALDADDSFDFGPPSEHEDEPAPKAPKAAAKSKDASDTYQMLSQIEHILKRPDSYIGSIETITDKMWCFDSDTKRMVHRDLTYVPGFFKIVDEILVNAADNKINDANMDTLKVDINCEEGTISIYNNGKGIPIEIHKVQNIYIPEMIFGHLLTSSNYDDDQKKLTGGRNGYGAKLTNIYSTEFTVETADKSTGQKYKQTWTDNMGKTTKAKITKSKEEFTRITFKPDLKRFGMNSIDDDTVALLKKRVYDMAGTVKDIKVILNDERLKIKNFKQYVDLYVSSTVAEAAEAAGGAAQAKPTIVHEIVSERWEVAFAVSEGAFQQVSFANSIATTKGGTHVSTIAEQIAKKLLAAITKKNKAATVKPTQIKNHMWIFVNALIENPTFDSQTKETLTLPASKFGSRPSVSDDFMKKVAKSPIIDNVLNWAKFKADQQIKKTDGSKRTRLTGLTKLCDANNAGSRLASKCTLILTEGDSAKALAVAGLSVVGRDNFGVFPLRGKLLNVREASHDQIMKNAEIQNIKKIMGLQHNKVYSSSDSLRYGRLMIMTDQDHDGSHIKGLLINFFDHFYPSLLKLPEFLVEFVTPIVRVTRGKEVLNFFTIPEFEKWAEANPPGNGRQKWSSKYYKGLGTSKDTDAIAYFSDMAKHMIPFGKLEDEDRGLIDMAFSKKKADDRKEWLRQFKPGTYLDHNTDEIAYSEFINKELVLFSMADNIRSIPSVVDGLKPGQRKVIFACFKRKLKAELKVAQLIGYISEHTAYHHGEQSLSMTIINLAQKFVGSNNINLLYPSGQFGTRASGGKDHASARYISTLPSNITRTVFHPADDALLNYLTDDGDQIEPEWYLPVVPMVLVNGSDGIGTGWSTSIPNYNPLDVVANIRRLLKGEEQVPMAPWFRGFKGTIEKTGDGKYLITGAIKKVDEKTVEILELPIRKWTDDYKGQLEEWVMTSENSKGFIKDYKEYSTNTSVNFIVTLPEKELEKAEEVGLEKHFKLTTTLATTNMICFDFEGKIKKYTSPEEIIEEFFPRRLQFYQKRKDMLAGELQTQLERLNNQARFVKMIIDKQLVVSNRKKADIVAELRQKHFTPFPKVSKAKQAGETEATVEADADEDELTNNKGENSSDFDYLLGMAIWSLTKEKVDKLLAEGKTKEAELMALLELTPGHIWNTDLDRFEEEWEALLLSDIEDTKAPKGKKGATLKTRKSLGKGKKKKGDDSDNDSEDDFRPVAKSKAAPKASSSKLAEEPKAKARPRAAAAKVFEETGDDDDGDIYEVPAKKSQHAPGPSTSSSAKVNKVEATLNLDDSDVEMPAPELAPPKKPPVARKVSAMKKKGATSAAESSDIDVVASAPTKGKASLKRKSLGSEVEDDDMSLKPAAKKAKQSKLDDFISVPAAKPAAKSKTMKAAPPKAPLAKKAAPRKKKPASSDEEADRTIDASPVAAPKRSARATSKPSKYVDISDDDEGGGGDEDVYEQDDDSD